MTEPLPPRVGVIADDLTSAADGAGVFVDVGFECVVGCRGRVPDRGEVRSVDTGSRALKAGAAEAAVRIAVEELRDAELLFKTVDSTVRGHVAREMRAAFEAGGRHGLVFAPAFPEAGRTTAGGAQLVDGRPVNETEYADDPVHPACHARLAKLCDPALGEPALVDARDASVELAALFETHRVVIVDVEDQAALDAFVQRAPSPESVLWMGSPGMARALSRLHAPREAPKPPRAERVLIAVGSMNPGSRRQAARLKELGVPFDASASTGAGALCITTPEERVEDAPQASRALAEQAAALIRGGGFDGLIATGGETLEQILRQLGILELTLLGELEPGFPVARVDAPLPLIVAMKAGGFGDDDTLARALRALSLTQEESA